jgi:hypothetical protein
VTGNHSDDRVNLTGSGNVGPDDDDDDEEEDGRDQSRGIRSELEALRSSGQVKSLFRYICLYRYTMSIL